MLDSQGAGSHSLGNLASRVRGSVVHQDHLVRLRDQCHCRANAVQALANPKLFIMGWNYEGEHAWQPMNSSLTAAGTGRWHRIQYLNYPFTALWARTKLGRGCHRLLCFGNQGLYGIPAMLEEVPEL